MKSTILCFGEALLDLLPTGAQPGGAPLNVAYHLNQLGTEANLLTRIGRDEHGQNLLHFMSENGLDRSLVQTDAVLKTGVVNVTFNNNEPSYDIVENVAWGAIDPVNIPHSTRLIVHGSLVLRSSHNQQTLKKLKASTKARLVFDVNFRYPFYSEALIREWLAIASLVKVNEHELHEILHWFELGNAEELLTLFPDLELLIVTKGSKGAEVITTTEAFTHPGFKVAVTDTVGSGDAFLAAFLHHYLAEVPLPETLEYACATGAFVATQRGATPTYSPADISAMLGISD